MIYSCITLKGFKISDPASLPIDLIGLSDASLADLSAALKPTPTQYRGLGFWPVTMVEPTIDPTAQTYTEDSTLTIDKSAKTVTATRGVRDLTDEEKRAAYEASNPVPVEASKLFLIRAMRQLGIKDDFDMAMAASSEDMLEDWEMSYYIRRDNPSVATFANLLGKDSAYVDDLYRMAAQIKRDSEGG